jgi:predicted nucleic acid-binding protein
VILVDTSVWVDHLRGSDPVLIAALEAGEVTTHPFVIGELACGNLQNRTEVLGRLQRLPRGPLARDAEVLVFIDAQALSGRGIGYSDAHLLASAALAGDGRLWTRDKRLAGIAGSLGLAFSEP